MRPGHSRKRTAFSLVEVVLAIGVVAFAVLSVFGLLAVGNDTNKRARDEGFAAQLAHNEFQRIRSLSSQNFPANTYAPRYYDSNLSEVDPAISTELARAAYKLQMTIVPNPTPFPSATPIPPPVISAQFLFNAEVRYPANAPAVNQNVARFPTLIVSP